MVLHASQPWATPLTLIVACFVFRLQAMAMVSPALHGVICHSRTTRHNVCDLSRGVKYGRTTDDGCGFLLGEKIAKTRQHKSDLLGPPTALRTHVESTCRTQSVSSHIIPSLSLVNQEVLA